MRFRAIAKVGEDSGLESRLGRNHRLMQDADDQDSSGRNAVEHDMFSVLEPAQPDVHRITGSPHSGRLGKRPKTFSKSDGISRRLFRAPLKSGIPDNAANIGSSDAGNKVLRQLSRSSPWLTRRYRRKAP